MGINEGRELWSKARGEADERKDNKALEGQAVRGLYLLNGRVKMKSRRWIVFLK